MINRTVPANTPAVLAYRARKARMVQLGERAASASGGSTDTSNDGSPTLRQWLAGGAIGLALFAGGVGLINAFGDAGAAMADRQYEREHSQDQRPDADYQSLPLAQHKK